jgi:hypothetical protein
MSQIVIFNHFLNTTDNNGGEERDEALRCVRRRGKSCNTQRHRWRCCGGGNGMAPANAPYASNWVVYLLVMGWYVGRKAINFFSLCVHRWDAQLRSRSAEHHSAAASTTTRISFPKTDSSNDLQTRCAKRRLKQGERVDRNCKCKAS